MSDQININIPLPESSFIGLHSYSEEQSNTFFGRDTEIEQLTKLVESNTLTIVFGKSGTGKTSLLNAGVLPKLRKNYCLPFRIRLEFMPESPDIMTQIKNVLKLEIDKYGFNVESYPASGTLWEYFHREPLWKSVTPVLIFDQFEEIFTLAGKNSRFGQQEFSIFWNELSDLIENSIPLSLKDQLLNNKEKFNFSYKDQKTKVLFSFREEYLPEFESLTAIIPSLNLSRFRLLQMSGTQAYEVITKTWGNAINPAQAEKLVSFFSNNPEINKADISGIEPSLLSQVCTHIEKERIREGEKNISAKLLDKYPREVILRSIYNEALAESNNVLADDKNTKPGKADTRMNAFVEDKLITAEGYRISHTISGHDYALIPGIELLKSKYFLRQEDKTIELTHDVLTPLIKSDRENRRKAIALAIANRKARRRGLLIVALVLLAGALTYYLITKNAYDTKEKLNLESDSLKIENARLDSTNLKLIEDNKKYPNIDSFRNIINENNAAIKILNERIDALNKKPNDTTRPSNPNNDTLISQLNDSLQKMKDHNTTLIKDNNAFKTEKANLSEQIAALKSSINNLQRQLNTTNAQLKDYIDQLNTIGGKLETADTKLVQWKAMYEKLQKEFDDYRLKFPVTIIPPPPPPPWPDSKSVNVKLGFGKPGPDKILIPNNLVMYLIPNTRANRSVIRNAKTYEVYCDEAQLKKVAVNNKPADYYNGRYFFSDVPDGEYLLKVCSYYGDYKIVKKEKGNNNFEIKLKISPTVQ